MDVLNFFAGGGIVGEGEGIEILTDFDKLLKEWIELEETVEKLLDFIWFGCQLRNQNACWLLVFVDLTVLFKRIRSWEQADGCMLIVAELVLSGVLFDHTAQSGACLNGIDNQLFSEWSVCF